MRLKPGDKKAILIAAIVVVVVLCGHENRFTLHAAPDRESELRHHLLFGKLALASPAWNTTALKLMDF